MNGPSQLHLCANERRDELHLRYTSSGVGLGRTSRSLGELFCCSSSPSFSSPPSSIVVASSSEVSHFPLAYLCFKKKSPRVSLQVPPQTGGRGGYARHGSARANHAMPQRNEMKECSKFTQKGFAFVSQK